MRILFRPTLIALVALIGAGCGSAPPGRERAATTRAAGAGTTARASEIPPDCLEALDRPTCEEMVARCDEPAETIDQQTRSDCEEYGFKVRYSLGFRWACTGPVEQIPVRLRNRCWVSPFRPLHSKAIQKTCLSRYADELPARIRRRCVRFDYALRYRPGVVPDLVGVEYGRADGVLKRLGYRTTYDSPNTVGAADTEQRVNVCRLEPQPGTLRQGGEVLIITDLTCHYAE